MKRQLKIEIKKIRNQLKIHGLSDDEKNMLRKKLEELKIVYKQEN